jgi:hypothetical protein
MCNIRTLLKRGLPHDDDQNVVNQETALYAFPIVALAVFVHNISVGSNERPGYSNYSYRWYPVWKVESWTAPRKTFTGSQI